MSTDTSCQPESLDLRSTTSGPKGSQANKPELTYELNAPVYFIGFMGAGKTSVSRKLARICGLSSIDMDTYIERQEGKTVSDIFAEQGEAGFRTIETQVLRKLSDGTPSLIGCGGGVVTTPENRQILKDAGCVVFLRVEAREARGRISDLSTRPLFNKIEDAERRNLERLPLYREVADIEIDTSGKTISAIAREVRRELQKKGVLCAQRR